MAKQEVAKVKLHLPAGKANPSPPVGPALSQHGVNIMEFCKVFNNDTAKEEGMVIPVVITVFSDRSFTYIKKTPPASILLKKAAGVIKGSSNAIKEKVGTVTKKQVEDIARLKLPDLNANDVPAAVRIVEGTARSMGIDIVE